MEPTLQCICPPFLATAGANCTTATSNTWGFFSVCTIIAISGIVSLILCVLTLLTVVRKKARRSFTFYFTILPTLISSIFGFLYALQWQIRLVLPSDEIISYYSNGEPYRRTAMYILESSSFVISLVSFVFCMINFSLLWIEVLNRASEVSVKMDVIKIYRRVLIVLYAILLIAATALAALENYDLLSYVAAPYFILVCIFYGVAWWKVRDTRHRLFPNQISVGSVQNEHLKILLDRVRAVAVQVFFLTLSMVICAFGFAISPNEPYTFVQQYFGLCLFMCGTFDILTVAFFSWQVFRVSPSKQVDSNELGPVQPTIKH